MLVGFSDLPARLVRPGGHLGRRVVLRVGDDDQDRAERGHRYRRHHGGAGRLSPPPPEGRAARAGPDRPEHEAGGEREAGSPQGDRGPPAASDQSDRLAQGEPPRERGTRRALRPPLVRDRRTARGGKDDGDTPLGPGFSDRAGGVGVSGYGRNAQLRLVVHERSDFARYRWSLFDRNGRPAGVVRFSRSAQAQSPAKADQRTPRRAQRDRSHRRERGTDRRHRQALARPRRRGDHAPQDARPRVRAPHEDGHDRRLQRVLE